jgi:ribonuclease HI
MTTQALIKIYTDGSCQGNPGPGGWAALIIEQEKETILSGGEKHTTNNRMELMAALQALLSLTTPCIIECYTDSQYLRLGITTWLKKWQTNGWKTASKKEVKNKDLWQSLHQATQIHQLTWHWVKAHSGHRENELVDQLAKDATPL